MLRPPRPLWSSAPRGLPGGLTQQIRDVGFPYMTDSFTIDGRELTAAQVLELLQPFLGEARGEKVRSVAASRTFTVLPIVEGVYDMGNLAAVCRSADGEWKRNPRTLNLRSCRLIHR